MGRFIYWAIVSVILSLFATLVMGGGQFVAAAIHDMDLTFTTGVWALVILVVVYLIAVIARKYRDFRAMYQGGGHS